MERQDEQHDKQQERLHDALDRKQAEAREKAEASRMRAEQAGIDAPSRQPGDVDPRTKNSRHGQVTADKWNQ